MKRTKLSNIIKYSGAYIACMIGSGFATGQEILQFYSAFGLKSILTAIVSMLLFCWSASTIMADGHEVREMTGSEFRRYCGPKLGAAYEYFVTAFVFCLVVLMISGAGATLNEHYGLPYYVGSGILALMVFTSYALGMTNLVSVLGFLTPVIITFTMFVGIVTLIRTGGDLSQASESLAAMAAQGQPLEPSAPSWFVSGILYPAYNLIGAVIFMARLGCQANTRAEAALSGVLGGVIFIAALTIMNLAFLANIGEVGVKQIPSMVLASHISPLLANVFAVVIMLSMFSVAAPMCWTVCTRFSEEGTIKSKVVAAIVVAIAFAGGQLPFGKLVSIVYPITGYMGILLFVCLAIYSCKKHLRRKQANSGKAA